MTDKPDYTKSHPAVADFGEAMKAAGTKLADEIGAAHGINLSFCAVCGIKDDFAAVGKIEDFYIMAGALDAVIDEWDKSGFYDDPAEPNAKRAKFTVIDGGQT